MHEKELKVLLKARLVEAGMPEKETKFNLCADTLLEMCEKFKVDNTDLELTKD
jgi:hypothetical protein